MMPSVTTTDLTSCALMNASDLFSDDGIQTYIGFLREPAFERIGFAVFLFEDANCDFRGRLCSRPVEGYGRDRVSAESPLYLSVQPR